MVIVENGVGQPKGSLINIMALRGDRELDKHSTVTVTKEDIANTNKWHSLVPNNINSKLFAAGAGCFYPSFVQT
jgi:hypothetical protein